MLLPFTTANIPINLLYILHLIPRVHISSNPTSSPHVPPTTTLYHQKYHPFAIAHLFATPTYSQHAWDLYVFLVVLLSPLLIA